MKVGFGFDAHRLVPGRPLILGGCRIPFERGLEGYSDADVVAHALIDALLGAAAMGDCGSMFPAGNPEFAGADSIGLLRRAVKRLNDAGFKVGNVDCTIVAERPALAPHLDTMRQTLADAVGIALELCSVKAKHTEGMGYTGEGIGMAAYAVAMLL
ncbi:MAG TPA: 2-C-methyl-D-erythritol 2,4-cyclodiphosphate synthase [Candidatus Eremiobacteraceae bacterium]|nr:2-C-methyl-D-erythritol 2,4-cyclodiphosphate synthase [Candidatus Eremiobacteraceae bacterium]